VGGTSALDWHGVRHNIAPQAAFAIAMHSGVPPWQA
jgi:hypothetical protein